MKRIISLPHKIFFGVIDRASIFAYRKPFVVLSVLCVLLLATGVPLFAVGSFPSDTASMLVPSDSPAGRGTAEFRSLWKNVNPAVSVTIRPRRGVVGSDALSKDVLLEAFDFESGLRQITAAGNTTLKDICLQPYGDGRCMSTTVFDFWKRDRKRLEADKYTAKTVSLPGATNEAGFKVNPGDVLDGIRWDPVLVGLVINATGLRSSIMFNSSDEALGGFDRWRKEALRFVSEFRNKSRTINVNVLGLDDSAELFASRIEGRVGFVVAAAVAFSVLFCLSGGVSVTWVSVSLGYLVLTLLGIASSLGILYQVPLTPFTFSLAALPTLMLSAFHLRFMSTSFQDAGASTKDSESCLRGLSGFVVSSCIAATSVSFAGLVVPVPAIKWSCEQLAVSSVLQAFLATFGFPALVALVESEFYGQSLIQFPEGQPEKTTGCRKYAPSKHTALAQEAKAVPSTQCASVRSVTAVLVVALAAVFAVECLFMIARAEPSLDSSILVPENSLTAEYLRSVGSASSAQSVPFFLMTSDDFPYNDTENLRGLMAFVKRLLALPSVKDSAVSWLNDLETWSFFRGHGSEYLACGRCIPGNKFYQWLSEFLSREGKPHQQTVKIGSDGYVAGARILCTATIRNASIRASKVAEDEIFSILKEFPSSIPRQFNGTAPEAFVFGPVFGLSGAIGEPQRQSAIVVSLGAGACLIASLLAGLPGGSILSIFLSALFVPTEVLAFHVLGGAGANALSVASCVISLSLAFCCTSIGLSSSSRAAVSSQARLLCLPSISCLFLALPMAFLGIPALGLFISLPLCCSVLLSTVHAVAFCPCLSHILFHRGKDNIGEKPAERTT